MILACCLVFTLCSRVFFTCQLSDPVVGHYFRCDLNKEKQIQKIKVGLHAAIFRKEGPQGMSL